MRSNLKKNNSIGKFSSLQQNQKTKIIDSKKHSPNRKQINYHEKKNILKMKFQKKNNF